MISDNIYTTKKIEIKFEIKKETVKNYLNHLINCNEILAATLVTWHNVAFFQDLMKKIRSAINNGKFEDFYNQYFDILNA